MDSELLDPYSLRNGALHQLYETSSLLLQQSASNTFTGLLSFSVTRISAISGFLHGCKRPAQSRRKWEFTVNSFASRE